MQFRYASDQSLLVNFGDKICLDIHHQVRKLLRSLQQDAVPGVVNLHPAYCSLLVRFDPCRVEHQTLERILRDRVAQLDNIELGVPRTVEIPVCYGGESGPDLKSVAALHAIPADEVVRLHSEVAYTVYFLGFVPGFAYLGGMPEALATPRLSSPRRRVEAGSVGIGGSQTGVYPFSTPGGWRIIGRTPVRIFQASRASMSLLEIGDQVRFRPVDREQYEKLAGQGA